MSEPSRTARTPAEGPPASPDRLPAEPVQRWRLAFARGDDAPVEPHREAADRLETALVATGLPLANDPRRGRPRLTYGPPMPLGMPCDRELLDLWLTALRPIHVVRAAVSEILPPGYRLIDLYDIWRGAPPLVASVVGAEYRADLAEHPARAVLEAAARDVLGATTLPRRREKGTGAVDYDLRPLLDDISLATGRDGSCALLVRVRFDVNRGAGRPEEVLAALADAVRAARDSAHVPITAHSVRRTQLLLAAPD